MRRSTLMMCALLAVATFGCDKVRGFFTKKRGTTATPTAAADSARRDSIARARAAAPQAAPPPPAPALTPAPVQDIAYTSEDTGTVAPGMAERDVYALWGAPVAVRRMGDYTYLYFRNGCEKTCGTMDLVILQTGQVVDAIVRWPGHGYSGQSSSPPDRKPEPTKP